MAHMRFMKWFLILLGKSVLALLSVAGVLLLVLEGWLIWHVEYGIGLPTETQLAALPATGLSVPETPAVSTCRSPRFRLSCSGQSSRPKTPVSSTTRG